MSAITPQEKLTIATNFLLAAPPGEYNEVVTDVRALVNNDGLLNQQFAATSQEYNTEQMVPVEPPGLGYKVLLTKFGEIDATHYNDPKGHKVMTVDHVKQQVTSVAAGSDAGACEAYRVSIQNAMQQYVADHYQEGVCTVYGSDSPMSVTICISAAKFSPSNFWNGRWRSIWVVNFSGADAEVNLEGTFKLAVHYYEDGNVQLASETQKSVKSKFGPADQCGANVQKAISRAENDYQTGIEESYKIMGERSFKGLRRKLPVTRQPMDWEKAVGYRLGKELSHA